jgi:S-DNA-T family DNA segregation ATPase FtsK/SpoIIIE
LESFGVQARVVNVVHGPTVTRYELQPARGVKVSRFTSLTNDIALALAAVSIRIEAPIPGKSAIGIEVPNLNTELVVLKDILGSENFRKGPGLCLGLGKDITGQAQMTDLQKMPHLLVAGTTGSGKSVCINTLILSLIYRFTPRRLQLLMVDPKQVELSIYEGLPHLVGLSGEDSGRILVDPKKAAMALKQVVDLMEARYTLFAKARVRNLKEYNDQAEEFLPWMVVIIDELADLMMVASKTVETSICRLAQKARAAGIHLVVATQRPSTDVITGLIKVNIPSRIAFAVSSGVDSRVILDTSGAENLLGKGDMLFLPVDASEPRRIQGAYVTNEEIQRVVEFWREQAAPENRIELEVQDAGMEEATGDGDDDNSDDDLVQEALAVVLRCQQASASMLQTELKVGYARARRILMVLERKGYVGPAEGSKPRKILYTGGEVC